VFNCTKNCGSACRRALVQFFLDLSLVERFQASQQAPRLLFFALELLSRNGLGKTGHRWGVEQTAQWNVYIKCIAQS
jgi:hypothetical protein